MIVNRVHALFVEIKKVVLNPLELELGRVASWVLGIETGSSARASALNRWSTSSLCVVFGTLISC